MLCPPGFSAEACIRGPARYRTQTNAHVGKADDGFGVVPQWTVPIYPGGRAPARIVCYFDANLGMVCSEVQPVSGGLLPGPRLF
jgi:hypothetical protein